MSQDEVKELVDFLKKDFRIKTGMNLVAFPEVKRVGKCKIPEVADMTAGFFNLSVEQLCEVTRRREIIRARQMLCALLRKMRYKLKEIGAFLNQDHTTIIHAINKFESYMATEEDYKLQYRQLLIQLQTLKPAKHQTKQVYHEVYSD